MNLSRTWDTHTDLPLHRPEPRDSQITMVWADVQFWMLSTLIGAESKSAPNGGSARGYHDVAGCVAIPSYSPADSDSAGFLCIAAYVGNSLFCDP